MSRSKEYEMLFKLKAALDGSFDGAFGQATSTINELQGDIREMQGVMKDIGAYKRQQASVTKLQAALERYRAELESAKAAQQMAAGTVSELEGKIGAQRDTIEQTKADIAQYSAELAILERQKAETGDASGELAAQIAETEAKLAESNRALQAENRELEEMQGNLNQATQNVLQFTDRVNSKTDAVNKTETSLERSNARLGELGDALENAGVDTSNLAGETERLRIEFEALKEGAVGVSEAQPAFGDMAADFGKVALKAGAAVVSIRQISRAIRDSIGFASGFQYQMSAVEALSGASADEMERLRTLARDIGMGPLQFTKRDAAYAMEHLAMASWNVQEKMAGLPSIMILAAAAGEDLANTAGITADSMAGFNMAADEAARFTDVLAATAANSHTNVSMMGATFQQVAPVAGAMGFAIEDTALAIGLMANAGIKGSASGTALRNILTNMADPTDAQAAAMNRLGISLTYADGTTRDLGVVIDDLRSAFANLDETQKAQYASTIAGRQGMAGLLAIVNTTEEKYNNLAAAIANSAGAAQEMANIRMDNHAGQMAQLSSAWESLSTNLGGMLLPGLTAGAGMLTGLIGALDAVLSGAIWDHTTATQAFNDLIDDGLPELIGKYEDLREQIQGVGEDSAEAAALAGDLLEVQQAIVDLLGLSIDVSSLSPEQWQDIIIPWTESLERAEALNHYERVRESIIAMREYGNEIQRATDAQEGMNDAQARQADLQEDLRAATDRLMEIEHAAGYLRMFELEEAFERINAFAKDRGWEIGDFHYMDRGFDMFFAEAQTRVHDLEIQLNDGSAAWERYRDQALEAGIASETAMSLIRGLYNDGLGLEEILALGPEFAEFADDIKRALGYAADGVDDLTAANEEQANSLYTLIGIVNRYADAIYDAYRRAHDAAYVSLTGQINLTREFGGATETTFADIMSSAESWRDGMNGFNRDVQAALAMGLDPALAERYFSSFTPDSAGIAAALVQGGAEGIAEFNEMMNTELSGAASGLADTVASFNGEFIDEVERMMLSAAEAAGEGAEEMMAVIVQAIVDNGGIITEAEVEILRAAHTAAQEATADDAAAVGEETSSGIAQGIRNKGGEVGSAVAAVVRAALERGRRELDSNSPSREAARLLGVPFGEGVEVGILSKIEDVNRAMAAMVGSENYREAQQAVQSEDYREIVALHPALLAMAKPKQPAAAMAAVAVPPAARGGDTYTTFAPQIYVTVEGGGGDNMEERARAAGAEITSQLDRWWQNKQEDERRRRYV
ncbi:MAG: phage tail tape measure protein [Oscillospiraceae bacterium]|nr:phage tail tape measure protein [Oscillospiraceae bacterium]